jgi:hypothetical protein
MTFTDYVNFLTCTDPRYRDKPLGMKQGTPLDAGTSGECQNQLHTDRAGGSIKICCAA